MATIFTKIINGELPCHKICENERFLAFLDIRPINPGHTLVIPKAEIDYIFEVDDAELGGLMIFAKKIALAIERGIDCKRIGVIVAGLEVPHAHIHLIPFNEMSELTFARAKPTENDELADIAEKIRQNM